MKHSTAKLQKWKYPVLYLTFFIISMLPLYTQRSYAAQDTQNVIIGLLMKATAPYQAFAPVFHVATIVLIAFIAWKPKWAGRMLSGYMALNYFIIAMVTGLGTTEQYGFVIHTGGLIMYASIGFIWVLTTIRKELQVSFSSASWKHLWLLPLALLAFWAPYETKDNIVYPNFDPVLLLSSPDYGLTFCLTTPVFMFLLILFHPHVGRLAYRITAFNGLLYGVYNLTLWFKPEFRWMGFLHVPLLMISGYALMLAVIEEKRSGRRSKPTV